MKIQGKVVARMQTKGRDFARVGVKGTPEKVAALRFFDIEDFGELGIGDKLNIDITRVVEIDTEKIERRVAFEAGAEIVRTFTTLYEGDHQ